jgi:hypothetical protein
MLASPFAFGQDGGAGAQERAGGFEQVAGGGPGNGLTTTGTNWLTGRTVAGDRAATSGVGDDGLPRNILPPPFQDIEAQRQLNLTRDQMGRLGEADVRLRQGLKSALRDTVQLSRAAAAVRSDELLLKYNSDLMHGVAQILDARQMERYRQLSRASEGLLTFTDPDVVRGLKLTEKQQQRLNELKEQTDTKLDDLVKQAGTEVPATLAKAGELRREAMAQVGQILEPAQKDSFAKMTGYKFAAKKAERAGGAGGTGAGR